MLPTVEFVYNNSTHVSTSFSPFFAIYGKHPRLLGALENARYKGEVPMAKERVERLRVTRYTLEKRIKDA